MDRPRIIRSRGWIPAVAVLGIAVAAPAAAQDRRTAIGTFQSVKSDLNRKMDNRNDIRRGGSVAWRRARWDVFYAADGFARVWIEQNRTRPCRGRLKWLHYTQFCYKIRRAGTANANCRDGGVCRSAIVHQSGHHHRFAQWVDIDFSRLKIVTRKCGATALGGTLRGCIVTVDFGRRLPFRYQWLTSVGGRYVPPLRKQCQTAEDKEQWRTSNVFVFWRRSRRDRFVRGLEKMRGVCRR